MINNLILNTGFCFTDDIVIIITSVNDDLIINTGRAFISNIIITAGNANNNNTGFILTGVYL